MRVLLACNLQTNNQKHWAESRVPFRMAVWSGRTLTRERNLIASSKPRKSTINLQSYRTLNLITCFPEKHSETNSAALPKHSDPKAQVVKVHHTAGPHSCCQGFLEVRPQERTCAGRQVQRSRTCEVLLHHDRAACCLLTKALDHGLATNDKSQQAGLHIGVAFSKAMTPHKTCSTLLL